MNRLSNSLDFSFIQQLNKAREDIDALKTKQFMGADSFKTFRVFNESYIVVTQGTFDVVFTPTDTTNQNGLVFKMIPVDYSFTTPTDVSDFFGRSPISLGSNIQKWRATNMPLSGGQRNMVFYFFSSSDGTISIEYPAL